MRLSIGARVSARGLTWDVLEREKLGEQDRLRLRCVSDDLLGLEWDILYPQEKIELLRDDLSPERCGTLAGWRLFHQASLLEQVPGSTELLVSAPGRVKIEPYQLVPLMRALEMPRARLLLADGVGLGKTVEAGLIASEFIARRRVHRILIVAPAGPLLVQWEQEMRHRFGLRFTVLADQAALRDERRKLELGGNPFDAIAFCMTSLDFAKQEPVLEEVERSAWDLVIIDEAHHCVSAAGSTDREDTLRRRLAEVLARTSDALLLLTATPHDGYDPHFASLIELLDPSLVDGRGGLEGRTYRRHVVRRLKSHIADHGTGQPMFRERQIVPVPIGIEGPGADAVVAFHQALSGLVAPRLRRATETKKFGDALAFVSLLKRSVSTISACVNTLRVVADRYGGLQNQAEPVATRRERVRTMRIYRRKALRFGVLDSDSETDIERLEAEEIAADLLTAGSAELRKEISDLAEPTEDTEAALRALIRMGTKAAPWDPKLTAMLREIRQIRATEPHTNVLIYTEYTDSQFAAVQALRDAIGIAGEILTISGQDPEAVRTRAAERCANEDNLILVSTDSLAEGLNLQQRCHHLIHLDLPYNPNRLEQRNGRIDRYGQQHEPQIRYLCLAGTFEERLLLRLIAKYEKARAQLTFMPDTLGITVEADRLEGGLMAGFAEEQATLFPDDKPAVHTLDRAASEAHVAAYRDLLHEIDRAYEGFDRMAVRHGWFASQGLNADAALAAAAAQAEQASTRRTGRIDLVTFVADAAATTITDDTLALPVDWLAGLDGLPGVDVAGGAIRITRDHAKTQDGAGSPLTMLGHVHPVVRKAISGARRSVDHRVAAACSDELALLLTYTMEILGWRRPALRRVIAVRLPNQGAATVMPHPEEWLRLADDQQDIAVTDPWRLFVGWAPARLPEAWEAATAIMREHMGRFTVRHTGSLGQARAHLERWLAGRAEAICGAPVISTDLFGAPPPGADWRHLTESLERLAGFATDPTNGPAARREANSVVSLYQRRTKQDDEDAIVAGPTLQLSGMLMLIPPALAA